MTTHECRGCGRLLAVAEDQTDPGRDELAVDSRGLVRRNEYVCGECLEAAEDAGPIPASCLPPPAALAALERGGPRPGPDGRFHGGVWDGMTPEQVLADRELYRRLVGE